MGRRRSSSAIRRLRYAVLEVAPRDPEGLPMLSRQDKAVRICGVATLVVVLLALATLGSRAFDIEGLPEVRLTMGVAVLVAFAAFLVANVSDTRAARLVCVAVLSIVAIGGCVRAYVLVATHDWTALTLLDGWLAIGVALLFVPLCRSVWHEARSSPAAG
jgi:FtsH-binding integral membrane protein